MATEESAPSVLYARGVAENRWEDDPSQRETLSSLDRIHDELASRRTAGLWKSIQMRMSPQPVRGLYLWGAVGRGKTFLTDLLLESLPEEKKLRLHFHRFMGRVQTELARLEGKSDPLRDVAEHFAEQAQLFCLDEFFVNDIGDAMILAGLLESLFERGVTLVTTSNIQPDALYNDGLQRAKFLPAIALLKKHCEVRELQSAQDFRLRTLTQSGVYFTPDDDASERAMAATFEHIAPSSRRTDMPVRINGRDIAVKRRSDAVIWFSFEALCAGPRAVADYIELAQSYNTVLISGVPQLTPMTENEARRFIDLVDEFYDHGVNLVLAAAVPIAELYRGERLRAEFERTKSRLTEMQSRDYLSVAHKH
ncbi:MAG TPA: cell division protein ZapE [Rudaea sp.]|jgi:cell division protein ZapE|nr:cell division protein ZapE [Rudaea sp.]